MDLICDIAHGDDAQLRECLIKAAAEVYDTPVNLVREDVRLERLKRDCRRIKWNAQIPGFVYDDEKDEGA